MKAFLIKDIGEIEYEDVPIPEIEDNEVLVEVAATGICGSDIPRIYSGGAYFYPLISGHEFSGKVVQVGNSVDSSVIGKRVCVFPLIPCHECPQCKNKKYELCRKYGYLGSRQSGGFAEYVAVPEWNIMEIPDDISYETGALIEPMCVAVHAIRQTKVSHDDNIIVFGAGTIGLFIVMFLLEDGYRNVFLIGKKEIQKKKAIALGLPEGNYYNSNEDDLDKWINSKTDSMGGNVLFECVGKNETVEQCFRHSAYNGRIVLVGNPASDMFFDGKLFSDALRRELTIAGTWNSSFTHEKTDDWHYVLERLVDRSINPELLISHKMPFKDLIKGFEMIKNRTEEYIKVMGILHQQEI